MQRQSYDTAIKHIYRKQLESVIPIQLRQNIPRTNIHRWRKESDEKYVGCELNGIAARELSLLQDFSKSIYRKRLFTASVRIVNTLKSLVDVPSIEKVLRDQKEKIVELADRVKPIFSKQRFAQLIGISAKTLRNWTTEIHAKCNASFLYKCHLKHPLKTARSEVMKVKQMLLDPAFMYWPISSIAAFCRIEGILYLCDSTWYKLTRLLGISRPKPTSRRKKNKTGIRAKKPNEKWHADVSVFKIAGIKYYIYLLIDNFIHFVNLKRIPIFRTRKIRLCPNDYPSKRRIKF